MILSRLSYFSSHYTMLCGNGLEINPSVLVGTKEL